MKGFWMKFAFGAIIAIAIVFLVIGICSPFYLKSLFLSSYVDTGNVNNFLKAHQELGPIGDWLGGSSTPCFTVASFFILVAALMAQYAELRATREEFSEQSREFKEQNKLLSIQRFENTFFQMISLHHQIVSSIEDIAEFRGHSYNYTSGGNESVAAVVQKGRQVLTKWCSGYLMYVDGDKDELLERYSGFYKEKESVLGHYFRNLYHITEFINSSIELIVCDEKGVIDSNQTHEQRKKYIRILRAQLSTTELILLFYNSLTDNGQAFYKLIVDYKLLNNLSVDVIPVGLHGLFKEMNQV